MLGVGWLFRFLLTSLMLSTGRRHGKVLKKITWCYIFYEDHYSLCVEISLKEAGSSQMLGWCCSDSGKRSSDLDQELGQKVVSGQDSWLILEVDPTEISSGSNVDMSKR